MGAAPRFKPVRILVALAGVCALGGVAVILARAADQPSPQAATAPDAPVAAPRRTSTQYEVAVNAGPDLLARLCAELPEGAGAAWDVLPGCPRKPVPPALLVALPGRLVLATDRSLEVLDLEDGAWRAEPRPLPRGLQRGATLLADGLDHVVVGFGGGRSDLVRVDVETGEVEPLPPAPEPLRIGAALVDTGDELLLALGGGTDRMFGLPDGAERWMERPRVGGESPMHTTFGRSSGFLARLGTGVYAWPDHHIHRLDLEEGRWKPGNWHAMKFLPSSDGGGVAPDPSTDSILVACGAYSRSLAAVVPTRNPESYFLRPRLPFPLIGEGDRIEVTEHEGEPRLFVYAIEPENAVYHLPTSALERVTTPDDRADTGTAWHRADFYGGGNGVRRWETRRWRAIPGPTDNVPRTQGTLVVMGPIDRPGSRGVGRAPQELFFLRRAFVRRARPDTLKTTHYPGINLGRNLALGGAGVHDGDSFLYVITGRSTYFLRWAIPRGVPEKTPPEHRLPLDETTLEVLPPLPAEVGRGAALAHHEGTVYALRGGGTRDAFAFDVGQERWRNLTPLPEEATAPGEGAGGLLANARGLFAVPDETVWHLDPAGGSWTRFAGLGFGPDWDGGMVAGDGDRHLYVVRGGVSTRFGRLDLETRRFEELLPRPPDVISGEGNRLAILTVEEERRLYIHRGHNSNEVLWIRLDELTSLRGPSSGSVDLGEGPDRR